MSEPTLTGVFGSGASQTATDLIISKADLTGLTPSTDNTAESLVAGLILKLRDTLSQTEFASNTDQSIYIADGFPTFTFRGTNNDQYRVDQININFAKPDEGGTIDPDDY